MYCLPLFCNTWDHDTEGRFSAFSKGDLNKLQILQNKVLHPRSKQNKYTPVSTLLKYCNQLSVNQLGAFHTLLTMHKAIYEEKPKYVHDKLIQKAAVEGQIFPARQQNKVKVPNYQLTISRGSFCYRGATLWNKLPLHLRSNDNYKKFKPQLKK